MLILIIKVCIEIIAFIAHVYIGLQIIRLISRIICMIKKKLRGRFSMNIVQKLLAVDAGKIKTPEKDVKMKLQKLEGIEFVFPCKAVDPEYVAELQENALEFKKSELKKIRMYETKVMTIIEGCPDVFKNNDVLKHFGARTPKDLVKKLLLSGEMDDLKAEIDKLGGYDREEEVDQGEEIKN